MYGIEADFCNEELPLLKLLLQSLVLLLIGAFDLQTEKQNNNKKTKELLIQLGMRATTNGRSKWLKSFPEYGSDHLHVLW